MVKLLKSPNCTHVGWEDLVAVGLGAIVEVLEPNVVEIALVAGTPIVVFIKTTNHVFLIVQQVQFILIW